MTKIQLGSVRANSLQVRRVAPLLLAGVLAFGAGVVGHYYYAPTSKPSAPTSTSTAVFAAAAPMMQGIADSAPVRAAAEMHEMAAAAVAPKPEHITREVEVADGHSFSAVLTDSDVAPDVALAVAAALNKVYDHRKLKAGQEVTLAFTRLGADETLDSVTFQAEPTKEITITRAADGAYTAQAKVTPLERKRMAARAAIRGSLYETGAREGVPRAIMAGILRAYAHEVDFQRDLHAGDKFEVLYDQPTAKDGTPVGQGTIIYAALEIGGKRKPLYRVTFADGAVDYFDERGQSVKRALLRTPVEGARMTSGFGMRLHPLLGFTKMHQGVDFGAPTGTPIYAAGAGTVEFVGTKGGYGRYIELRHNGKLETAYAHMSRFARGIYQGARVNQGDVIGYVGSSGRSTGPHLHFEVHVNGKQVNPLSVNLPTGRILEGQTLTQFRQGQAKIKQEFSTLLEDKAKTAEALPKPNAKPTTKVAENTRR